MAETLSLSSWNIRAGLGDSRRSTQLIDTIVNWQSDIVILPDAWHSDPTSRSALSSARAFETQGYDIHVAELGERRQDVNFATMHFAALVRQNSNIPTPIVAWLGTEPSIRPAFQFAAEVGGMVLDIFGIYLNDQSTRNRIHQVDTFIKLLETNPNRPRVVIGDMNDLPYGTMPAPLVRSKPFRNTLGRLHIADELFQRLGDMAEGSALKRLNELGFRSTSDDATVPSCFPILQLDYVLEHNLSANNLTVDAKVGQHSYLSDHRPIHAIISPAK